VYCMFFFVGGGGGRDHRCDMVLESRTPF
jgi:hypothetical protein